MTTDVMTDDEHAALAAKAIAAAKRGEVATIATAVLPLKTTDLSLIAEEQRIYYGRMADGSGYRRIAVEIGDSASQMAYAEQISRGEISLLEPGDVPGLPTARERQVAEVDRVFREELAAGEARQAAEAAARKAAADARAIGEAAKVRSFFRR